MIEPFDIEKLAAQYIHETPKAILTLAFEYFGDGLWLSFSGAEDVVLLDMVWRLNKSINVFTLDTGRLHPETYRFIEAVREAYQIPIEILSPDHVQLDAFVKEKGLFSFYKEGHSPCCGVRKIEPLRRKLSTVKAWITGQRKDQNPSTRAQVPVMERDMTFSTKAHTLYKFNPLANMSSAEVWSYIRMMELPYNKLHEQGFISIGCEPCTRAVLPNQHEREGRWWWEESIHKECGLHAANHVITKG